MGFLLALSASSSMKSQMYSPEYQVCGNQHFETTSTCDRGKKREGGGGSCTTCGVIGQTLHFTSVYAIETRDRHIVCRKLILKGRTENKSFDIVIYSFTQVGISNFPQASSSAAAFNPSVLPAAFYASPGTPHVCKPFSKCPTKAHPPPFPNTYSLSPLDSLPSHY